MGLLTSDYGFMISINNVHFILRQYGPSGVDLSCIAKYLLSTSKVCSLVYVGPSQSSYEMIRFECVYMALDVRIT